jgi:hypothetical protein
MNQSLPVAVNAQTAAGDQAGNRARFPPVRARFDRAPTHDSYRGACHTSLTKSSETYMVTWHAVPTVPCNTGTEDRGQAEADLSAGRATTTGILPTASLTSQVPIVMTEEVAPRAILLSQRPHLDLGAEPDRGAAGHNRALRRDGRLPAPGNRSYSPGNGDGQRPNPGAYPATPRHRGG